MEIFAGADISQATVLAGLVLANAAAILGAYVSVRERLAKLEVKSDSFEKDLDAAHGMIRKIKGE